MKIFIGLNNIAGYYDPLCEGLTTLGHSVSPVYSYQPLFGYGEQVAKSPIARFYTWLGNKRMRAIRFLFIQKVFWRCLQEMLRLPLLIWAILSHDVFIFSFGSRIFPGDLALLKMLGKKTIMFYHGSDSRPPFLDGCQFQRNSGARPKKWVKYIGKFAKRVRAIESKSTYIVNLPASGQFLSRQAISFLAIGIPCRPRKAAFPHPQTNKVEGPIRILHCPSNPLVKGTTLIRDVIFKLKEAGYSIDYIEVINQPNYVVHEELERCDLVIDQTYSDTPLAGFATEAATHGKPVIVSGYCQADTSSPHEGIVLPPSCYCHPSKLYEEVEKFVVNSELRVKLGACARAFVETHWNHIAVAGRVVELLENGPRAEWLFDPTALVCSGVMGADEESVSHLLKEIVQAGGVSALYADDKPNWKHALLELANNGCLPGQETLMVLSQSEQN